MTHILAFAAGIAATLVAAHFLPKIKTWFKKEETAVKDEAEKIKEKL